MTCVLTIQITPVEKQLFTLIAQGHTDRTLSPILHASEHTVRQKVERLKNKTGCKTRPELVAFAYDNKILTPEK